MRRLAWAGVRIEVGKVALFIDATAPVEGAPGPALETSAPRSFALITHHHGDHFDPAALAPVLGQQGYVVVQEDVARLIDGRALRTQVVRTFEPAFISRGGAEFVAWAVPASDGMNSPQVSWVVDGGGRRIIHCGDTSWHGGWWDIARAYGPFDAAFMPISGFRQNEARYVHPTEPMSLTAEQAVAASRILGARLVVPIHYGNTGDPDYLEEPNALAVFQRLAAESGLTVRLMKPGDDMAL